MSELFQRRNQWNLQQIGIAGTTIRHDGVRNRHLHHQVFVDGFFDKFGAANCFLSGMNRLEIG